jgi:hypothetical protein
MVISFIFLFYDFSGRYCPNTGLVDASNRHFSENRWLATQSGD